MLPFIWKHIFQKLVSKVIIAYFGEGGKIRVQNLDQSKKVKFSALIFYSSTSTLKKLCLAVIRRKLLGVVLEGPETGLDTPFVSFHEMHKHVTMFHIDNFLNQFH